MDKLNFLEKVAGLNPNLLYILQLDPHKIIYINSVIKDLLGLDPSFIIEKGTEIFESLIFADDYQLWLKNLENCFLGEEEGSCEVEIRVRTTNEEWRWFKINDKIFERDKAGKVTHIIGTANDIHEQKIWEEKQQEEHRRFKNAQEIGHIGSFERELPGNRYYYSREFYNILGLEPKQEEIGHEEFMSHVHPVDREVYQEAIDHTYASGEPLDMVTRAVKPDGSLKYIHRRAAIIKNEAGVPVRIYGTAQDITERIIVEEERKRLDNLMQSTEMVAGTGSYELDLSTNKFYFSKGLFRLFGYEPGDFEPSFDWINEHSHQHDISVVMQILEEAAITKKAYTYTRRIFRKDGQLRIIESQGSVIVNEHGIPEKFIGLVQDVTARKKAEEELRISEERSRNLLKVLQDAPDAYLVLTRDLFIEMASDAYLKVTQTKRGDIIGKHLFDVFPDNPSDPKATGVENLNASLQKVLSTKKPHRMLIQQYDVRGQDGKFEEEYWSPTNTPVISSKGEVDYIIHRVLNFTEVIKKQKAEKGLSNETEILKTSLEEIKLQAAQLKESRFLLQSIFDASPNSIILYKILRDTHGKVEDFEISMLNAYNIEQLGISREIIGKKLSQQFPQVKENDILNKFIKTAETGIPGDFETFYQGEGFNNWFHFRVTKLEDQLLVTSEDITERKKSEEIIQKMLNGSISAITILDPVRDEDGKIVDFVFKGGNKAAEKVNSIPLEKMVGSRLLELFPGTKNVFFDDYVKVVETGVPLRVQRSYSYEHFDHWFDVSALKMGDGFILTINDITEQKKAGQELVQLKEELAQRAKDRYRKIINSMDEAFCLLEVIFNENEECIDYKFLEVNPVFEEQSGIKDVLGKTMKEMVPTIESYWFNYYGSVAKSGEPLRFEDYSEPLERWFDIYAFRLDEMEENQVGVIFKDITERREAEDRQTFLLELNEKLRPLTDPEEIQITAMHILGSHLEVNRAFYSEPFQDKDTLQSNTGYNDGVEKAPDEVNLSAFEPEIIERFLNGETLVFNDTLQEQVLKGDQKKVADAMQVRAAITVPVIRNGILVAAIRIHQRTPRIWTAAEVSLVEEASRHTWAEVERARFGNALRESEQKFRDLVEASALATWETNPEGFVISDSPSWRAFTGQSYEEWKGYGWLNALPSEDRDLVLKKWEKAVSAEQKFNAEFRLIGTNGEMRWTNVKAVPIISQDGKVTKWAGMNLDIHEMKMTEEALIKARDEAEAASRAKEDFVSTMSHEIRTPLNAVIGLTNLLLDNNPRKDQEVNLNSLSFSAQNLLSLINDILDFSKLEAGKGEIDDNVFNLSSLILSLQQLYEPQAQNNGSSFSIHLDKKIPQHIETDQLKLSQILHNLVSNAVKFTRNGSIDLIIKVARREKDMLWLDFVVNDTGIGVPEEKLAHIFEKFSQAESSTVRQYGGTGLGLTITKLLLEIMGSEIKVESQVGKGSKFFFSLPVKEATIEKAVQEVSIDKQEEKLDLQKLNILLVEDVEINRNILLQFFQNWWELKPDEALNGKEALEMATQKKYDIILMDVRMPVMDGYEATKRIREIAGYENTPILALTADKNLEEQQDEKSIQFDDLITKPFDPNQLKQRILHHLNYSSINGKSKTSATKLDFQNINPPHLENGISNMDTHEEASFNVSRYTSLAGKNKEVLDKLLKNSIKAIKTYKEEFTTAAEEENIEALSNLIHKNTITLHYIQAKPLGEKITAYREILSALPKEEDLTNQQQTILGEFDKVLAGLQELIEG
ncbi:hypothetical protein BH23BAC2_BH23BAC2_18260 [soil metagenome]